MRILWGTEDAWIPTDLAQRLQSMIPDATLSLIAGASHLIQYDTPVSLMNEIRTWLATVH